MEWYEGEKHFITEFKRGYFVLEITPAGWVNVLGKWIERRETALKYCRHSKRRQQINKRIATAQKVLNVCIDKRVSVPDAIKHLRGRV